MGWNYWMIILYGHHLIRACILEEAFDIARRHNIGLNVLREAQQRDVGTREYREDKEFNSAPRWFKDKVIERRRRGLGGRIWCEDFDGRKMIETVNGDVYVNGGES